MFIHNSLIIKSGWQDSNLRPPAPKAGALTGLRYTPYAKSLENAKTPKALIFYFEVVLTSAGIVRATPCAILGGTKI